MTSERMEKRSLGEALILQGEQRIREIALYFGMLFARDYTQRIKTLSQQLRDSLTQDDDRGIDQYYARLQLELYELNQLVNEYYTQSKEDLWDDEDDNPTQSKEDFWDDEDDNPGNSPLIPSPRRPNPNPGTNDSAELPPIDHVL
jgi:molecular chaperone DnaK